MKNDRITLFCVTAVLLCVGIVMIYSASSIYAWEKYRDSAYFLKRQLFYLAAGIISGWFTLLFDYRKLQKVSLKLIWVSVFLLFFLLIPGFSREISGAKRWFRFAGVSFQISEFAFLAVIIYAADFIARKRSQMHDFRTGFLPPVIVLGTVALLILAEPDFGTTVALGLVFFLMLFIAGARLKHIGSVILAALPAVYILVFRVSYRRARMLAFLNPWLDPKGSGFQLIQSQIALGSGGFFGVGLGEGRQKLFYLPAAHTDFIFSIIGEELGLIGTMGILVLFCLLTWQGIKIARKAADNFGFFLCLGIVAMLSLKAFINIAVSCGVVPTKGLPLPFISYGGSSLFFDILGVALLLNVSKHSEA